MNLNKKIIVWRTTKMHCRDGLLLIIDGSNLAHRVFMKFGNLKSRTGEKTGLVYGFLRLLQSYLVRFKPSYVLVTFDTHESKESNFKKALLGGYKAHRDKNISFDHEEYKRQCLIVKKLLKYFNIPVIWDKKGLGHESDDYIANFAMKHHGKVEIVSSDKDFCQLLKWSKIKIYNPHKEKIINSKNCLEIQGYSPEECVDWLCLIGDSSDDIPGYSGIGPVNARKFLDEFGSIQKFLNNKKAKFPKIDRDGLEDLYARNKVLIDFQEGLKKYPLTTIPISKDTGKGIQWDKLKLLLSKYTLLSFMRDEFMEPFSNLEFYDIKRYENAKNRK